MNTAQRQVAHTAQYSRPTVQTLTSTTVACRVYFTGLTSLSESSTSLLLWFAGVWRTKLRRIWATTAFRSPPSAADTYVQSTSINWLYRAVGELHSAFSVADPMVWNSVPTEFRDMSVGFDVFRRTLKTIVQFARY